MTQTPKADCCMHAAFFRLDMLKCLFITFVLTWRDASYERRRCVIHSYRALLKIFCLQLSSKRLSGWFSHPKNKKKYIWKRKTKSTKSIEWVFTMWTILYLGWERCQKVTSLFWNHFLLCLIHEMNILESWYNRKKEYCNEHWDVCSISTRANQ